MQATDGNAIDYQFIKAQILEDAETFQDDSINVDRLFQGYQMSMELADEGLKVFGMGQGFLSMAAPDEGIRAAAAGHGLHHGGNAVLRWMATSWSNRTRRATSSPTRPRVGARSTVSSGW